MTQCRSAQIRRYALRPLKSGEKSESGGFIEFNTTSYPQFAVTFLGAWRKGRGGGEGVEWGREGGRDRRCG